MTWAFLRLLNFRAEGEGSGCPKENTLSGGAFAYALAEINPGRRVITGKKTGNFSIATQNLRISHEIRKILKNNSGLTAE
jgi:hypothetical protein